MKDIRQSLEAIVGAGHVFSGPEIEPRYTTDVISLYVSKPGFAVRPATTEQLAAVVRLAAAERISVTTIGGLTNTVGSASCDDGGIVISLERMSRLIEIDPRGMTVTVEAGAILQTVQEAVEAQDMLLPLDLGSRGSATIGGVISTNAGGLRVLRYGMTRDMVLGIEAVLADGRIVTSLRKTVKDNAGYDWKHLMIGSEGTLGIVTKAVLRLRPLPTSTNTALVALNDIAQASGLLRRLDERLDGQLSSFELMWNNFYAYISGEQAARQAPALPAGYPMYALVEMLGSDQERNAHLFQDVLGGALDDGLAVDVVIAQSERQRLNLWAVRDDIGEPLMKLWPFLGFDLGMPLEAMADFAEQSEAAIRSTHPDAHIFHYGHAGDGNLHMVVALGTDDAEVMHDIETRIYAATGRIGGTISAEHGIGLAKKPFIGFTRSPDELALMRMLKTALDPHNILNPGKVVPTAAEEAEAARAHGDVTAAGS